MNLIYRVLGWVAAKNERMSHTSVNFIPMNWVVMIGLGICAMIAAPEVVDGFQTGKDTSMGSPWLLGAIMLVSALAACLLLITFLSQYVVFQKTDTAPAAGPPDAPIEISQIVPGLTGSLILDQKTAQRFLNVPVVPQKMDTGDLGFFSKIDASTTAYGTVMLKQRVGIWYTLVKAGSVQALEPGLLYLGTGARPALKVRYKDAFKAGSSSLILSFGSEGERQAVAEELGRLAA